MNFLQGHALLRTKCHKPFSAPISEVFIADFCEMILENEYILTDDKGRIKTFQCTKGDRQFKGIMKYKIGEGNFDFSLCQGDEGKIFIDDKSYYISKTPSNHPTTQIYFFENQIVIKKGCSKECSNNKHSIESIEVVKVGLKASSLLNSIICSLSMSCSSHPSLSYFCFSSVETFFGFTFSFYRDGYHFYSVVLLSAFYNPLDLFDKSLEKLEDVLLFENDCFLISDGGVEIYLSSHLQIDFNFPSDLINKVIGSILCEERICFVSKKDVFLKIMYFLKYIEPFKWSHSLVITNNEKGNEIILDSPLPFIFGKKNICYKKCDVKETNDDYKHTINNNTFSNCVVVDLDNLIITNSSIKIEATKDFALRLAIYLDSKKKFILEKYPDNIQNILLYSHRYFKEEGLVSICPEDSDYSDDFISRFTSTRMFIRYIVEERFSPVKYIYNVQTKRIELIPYVNIEDYTVLDVIEVYVMIYDLKNNELTRRLVQTLLNEKRPINKERSFQFLLRRLSVCGEYSTISKIIKKKLLTLAESHKINVYENQKLFKINWENVKDLHIVNICDFGDFNIKNMLKTILNENNTRFPLKTFHSTLPHDKERCKFKTMIIKDKEIYNLYPLESLKSVFLSLPHKNEHPEIFYNLVGYFLYFELPFNCDTVDYVL